MPDASVGRVDAHGAALSGLLVLVPALGVDAFRERVLGREVEVVVVLHPVHVSHLERELERRGRALHHHRVVVGQRAARVVRAPAHAARPEDLVHAQARLAAGRVEPGAAGRVKRVDGQERVLALSGLQITPIRFRSAGNVLCALSVAPTTCQ